MTEGPTSNPFSSPQAAGDERSTVSRRMVLLIVALALLAALPVGIPVLIFVVKVGWPRVRDSFSDDMEALEAGAREARK